MGVSSSLYSGVSGLNANANAMSVIGNNIANANTVGFKASRAIFGDLLSSQISGSGGASQVGRGVGLSIVDNIFSQGTFENTETNTDLAVEGSGFFIVSDPTTGGTGNNYTRAGAFRFDAGGFLVNPEGYNVMGYDLDTNGNTVGDLAPIFVNTNSFTQSGPTANVDLNTNLNSDAQTILSPFASATAAVNTATADLQGYSDDPAYAALLADPIDGLAQGNALNAAADDELLFEEVVDTAIGDLRTAISTGIATDIENSANAVNTAITSAYGAPVDEYTALGTLGEGADIDLQNAALAAAEDDETYYTSAIVAANTLESSIDTLQITPNTPAFDPLNPSGTSNYATSIQVFDSLGSTHLMTTYFTKTDDQQWEWNSVVDGGELAANPTIAGSGNSGELAIVGSGTLRFDESGNLIAIGNDDGTGNVTVSQLYSTAGDTSSDPVFPRPTALTYDGGLTWSNGAVDTQQVAIDMQTTQYASPSVVVSQEQDGFGTGTLVKLSIDAEGFIVGNFSNGAPRKLMQMALAKFTNPNALDKIGNNMYSQSTSSGVPVIGTVGSGVGNIFTNALELSNVDLAAEFVKMITTQRGFSANSKTITTTDEMLAEVINLKR